MNARACIAATVREPERLLAPFLRYHLSSGFERVFRFFDDPADPAAEEAAAFDGVTVVRSTNQLRAEQLRIAERMCADGCARMTGEYPNVFEPGLIDAPGHGGLIVRQQLNLVTAMHLAREGGLEWLLSIDVDELFYSGDQPANEHFQSLSDRGVRSVVYLNHEALPEHVDIEDPFREVTLFLLNPSLTRTRPAENQPRFRAYRNGKSAIRLSEDALPSGSHRFRPRKGGWAKPTYARLADPCILHYAECGFERFAHKYRALGDFPDEYFPGVPAIGWLRRCRDLWRSGDAAAARTLYQERVVTDRKAAERLIQEDLALRLGPIFESPKAPP